MEVKRYEIPFKVGLTDTINLYPLTDFHLGTIHCDEEALIAKIEKVANDPFGIVILLGDLGEFITPKDKRWNPSMKSIASWLRPDNVVEDQRRYIVKLLEQIPRHRIIGACYGNHEEAIHTRLCNNIHQNICDDLKIDNLGFSCYVHLVFIRTRTSKTVTKLVAAHGGGGAITPTGKIRKLQEFMKNHEGQIYVLGHMHDILTTRVANLRTDESLTIRDNKKIGVIGGCWFRTYTQGIVASYGEHQLYGPTTIGCPTIKIQPYYRKYWVDDNV